MKKLMIFPFLMTTLLLSGCGSDGDNANPGSGDLIADDIDLTEMTTANNELGFQLLNEVDADENGNTFISPTSLSMALSMVYNGADGKTKEEIARVLGAEDIDLEEWNEKNASLFSALQHDEGDELALHIANAIWLQDQYHFQQTFSQNTSDYYAAQLEEINFQSGDAADRINNWVEAATNDKITDMVEAPLSPDLVSILMNAIYFKGEWKYGFDDSSTENRPFYLNDGSTEDVPLMSLQEEFPYVENDDFQAVALPYGDEESMSMQVILPKADTDLKEIRQSLTNESWNELTSQFQESKGTILLPKFELEYEIILNETLKQLGMESAFDRSTADFSNMIEEEKPLWIDWVIQKTFIEVNEAGTEAAAVTSIEIVTESAPVNEPEPFYMEVNRPFFFTITNEETGTILFMGEISKP